MAEPDLNSELGWACPVCGSMATHVLRTIRNENGTITRYRECLICEEWSFTTLEDIRPDEKPALKCTNGKNGKPGPGPQLTKPTPAVHTTGR